MEFLKDNRKFSFNYGGEAFWNLKMSEKVYEKNGELVQEYILEDGLKITNVSKQYPEFDAFEWVTYFENTGTGPSKILSEVFDADIDVPFAKDEPYKNLAYYPDVQKDMMIYSPNGSIWRKDEFYCDVNELVDNRYTNHIYPPETMKYKNCGGRSSDGKAPFFNIFRQNKGVIFAIGWTGQWNCAITRGEDYVNIKTGLEDTHFRLYPGEKIRTSSFVIMNYECDYTDSQNKWKRLVKKHFSLIGKPGRDEHGPLCTSLWGGMSSKGMIERIDAIGKNKLPFEYIWIDAGWYGASKEESPDEYEGDWFDYTGDWRINTTHHPDRLSEVRKAIDRAGKKFLLWFEPERVRKGTPIAKQHPEYLLENPDGSPNMLLNLGNAEAWQYCFDVLSERIETLKIDCYRQDFNFMPLEIWRKNDTDDRRGITEIKHIMGLYRLWDCLLEKFPHLIIDNCASGGRRIDIETLRRSIPLWRSDYACKANSVAEGQQAHGANFSMWLPYAGTSPGRIFDPYRMRSAYTGALTMNYGYSERENPCDETQAEWIKKYAEEYLRARPYFSCDIYPLTDALDGDSAWLAVQYDRPEEGDGIIQIFKREKSPYTSASFELSKIKADKTYRFTDADDNTSLEISGRTLIEKGLNVDIIGKRIAKLYFYTAE